MPVGIGAGKLGSNLGAVKRSGLDAQLMFEGCHIEAGKMEDLEHGTIFEERLQTRRIIGGAVDLNQMSVAVA